MNIENAAAMAANWWARRLLAGDREKFVEALYPLILADLKSEGQCLTECDYDPRDHLLTAVRAAGLECSGMGGSAVGILPMKHSLGVFPDRLEPKEGYGNWLAAMPVRP